MLNHYDLSHRSYTSSKNEPTSSFFDFVLSSPAKINLFFKILFKRPDGYHEIASLYQAIRLFDYLHFKKADTFTLTSSDPALAVDQTNLITKAVFLFCKHVGIEPRLHIHLDKNIPMQAGLGGGSGNAATTLFGMNALFNTGISSDKLALWSAELGSDVPFFFSSGSSYCTGRGEILQDIDQLKLPNTVTIVKPDFGLSTQLVYSHCKIADLPHNDPILTLEHIKHGSLDFYNDLEVPSFALAPKLRSFKQKLKDAGFSHVVMSGSGSAFFCFGEGNLSLLNNCFLQQVGFAKKSHTCWYE